MGLLRPRAEQAGAAGPGRVLTRGRDQGAGRHALLAPGDEGVEHGELVRGGTAAAARPERTPRMFAKEFFIPGSGSLALISYSRLTYPW